MNLRSGPKAVLLAALAALLLLSGCGDDEEASTETVTSTTTASEEAATATSTDATATSTSSTEATTEDGSTPPADVQVTKLTGFTSPTGNIGCLIDRRSVRCDVAERDWEPPAKPKGCKVDYGQGISLDAGAAPEFVCAGDTALGGGDPLPYGQSIASGLLRCESAESGMSCSDAETGRGFTISKQAYELR